MFLEYGSIKKIKFLKKKSSTDDLEQDIIDSHLGELIYIYIYIFLLYAGIGDSLAERTMALVLACTVAGFNPGHGLHHFIGEQLFR